MAIETGFYVAGAAAAAAVAACLVPPTWRLSAASAAKSVLKRLERGALSQMAASAKRAASKASQGGAWFEGLQQPLTSAATNTVDTDPSAYTGPTVYQGDHTLPLPFPPIADDTEAISGFVDAVKLKLAKPGDLVLNLGGGAFDGGPRWFETQVPGVQVVTADPFRRSAEHNEAVQAEVVSKGGADLVVSISVLNVIAEVQNRLAHVALAHAALKPGGVAYFKTWASCWPERGLGVGSADMERGIYQMERWADAYLAEVAAVFGEAQCFADNTANMLVAKKAASPAFSKPAELV